MSEKNNAAQTHPGMGSIPGAEGVSFRVWAPNAEKVYVSGTFNDWNRTSTPLTSEMKGYWFSAGRIMESTV